MNMQWWLKAHLSAMVLLAGACTPEQQQGAVATARIIQQAGGEFVQEPRASSVFPPDGAGKWFPLEIGQGKAVMNGGKRTWLVELRGWLTAVSDGCNVDDPDWHWLLEVDPQWADSVGMPLTDLIKPGNMLEHVSGEITGDTRMRTVVGTPNIDIELNGWVPRKNPGQTKPATWQKFGHDCVLEDTIMTDTAVWEYDPVRPLSWLDAPKVGDYVRMFGSLVTDEPHDEEGWPAQFLCRNLGLTVSCNITDTEKRLAKKRWAGAHASADPDNPARWTEMHPPDIIALLGMKPPNKVLRSVAISAENCAVGSCEKTTLDVDIPAPAKPAGATTVMFREQVLPSTNFRTITDGHSNGAGGFDGATVTTTATGIKVHVAVEGQALFGAPGRFGALYTIWWQ